MQISETGIREKKDNRHERGCVCNGNAGENIICQAEEKTETKNNIQVMKKRTPINMKHLLAISIFAMVMAYSLKCSGQVTMGMGAGTDFRHGLAVLNLGYEVSNIVIEGRLTPSLTRNVNANNFMGGSVGYDFGGLVGSAGYYYDLVSEDKRWLNKAYVGYSVKWYTLINDRSGLFINALYINKSAQLTAGIHYKFQ